MNKFLKLLFSTTLATGVATHLIKKQKQPLKKFQEIYVGKYQIIHPVTHKTNLIQITPNLEFLINHKHVDGQIIEINDRHLLFQDSLGFQIEILTNNHDVYIFIDETDQVKTEMIKV